MLPSTSFWLTRSRSSSKSEPTGPRPGAPDLTGPTTNEAARQPASGEDAHDVENGPDNQAEHDSGGKPATTEFTGPATDRVRIVGAETAADITSEVPLVSSTTGESADDDQMHVESDRGGDTQPSTDLPHWTEPPTGQVPAVLARDLDPSPVEAPTWREDDSDWRAAEESFEPSMFGDEDEVALGALDESTQGDEDRRPWEFDLDQDEADVAQTVDTGPGTEQIPVIAPLESPGSLHDPVAPSESGDLGRSSGAAGIDQESNEGSFDGGLTDGGLTDGGLADGGLTGVGLAAGAAGTAAAMAAEGTADDGEAASDSRRPSGAVRSGRVRRSSLRAGGLRAKRPADGPDGIDVDELPGASVADVPGAGGRPSGVAALAAADRSNDDADSAGDAAPMEQHYEEPVGWRDRLSRRGDPDRPLRSSSNYVPEETGGGPPAPPEDQPPSRPESASSTGLRVGTGVAIAVVALVAFKWGTVTALILSLVVVVCAAGEAFAVLRRAGWRPATLLGLVGTISLMVGAYSKGVAALPLVMVLLIAFTMLWYLFGVERGSAVAGTASTMLVVGWVALLGSFAGLLLSPSTFPNRHGIAFLLGAIVATAANDIGALVIGRWLGTRPLYPSISPNKTWEGLAGGALASILISTVVVGGMSPWSPSSAALLGVIVAIVAPLGDLSESLLKRDLRLKDMGTILPGHGGVLDRVDALLFVLPATYYLVRALNLG